MDGAQFSVDINAEPRQVYAVLRDSERFPDFIPSVVSVKRLSEEGSRTVTEWTVKVQSLGIDTKWTSEETWDPENLTLSFRPAGEAVAQLHGLWSIAPTDSGSRLSLDAKYELKVPALIKGMAQKAVQENLQALLNGIKARAESP